jgi:hypothetical protein
MHKEFAGGLYVPGKFKWGTPWVLLILSRDTAAGCPQTIPAAVDMRIGRDRGSQDDRTVLTGDFGPWLSMRLPVSLRFERPVIQE